MTSPGQTPEEAPPDQIPPPEQPQSPQAVAMDEALEQAENSIIPTIAALIAAEVAMSSIHEAITLDGGDDLSLYEAYRAGVWLTFPLRQSIQAGKALYSIIRGTVEAMLAPLAIFSWNNLNSHADNPQGYSSETRDLIDETIDETVERVTRSMDYILQKDEWSDQDFYALYGELPGKYHPDWTGDDASREDPRSATQRATDNFARQMARWLTRETAFTLQERVASSMGFTHKRWITMHDHKVRDFHRILHGRTVPLGQKFSTPVGDLRYPGDTTAPIGLWINCRCVIEWIAR